MKLLEKLFGPKTTDLTFIMAGGNSFIADKVTEWEVRHQGSSITYLKLLQAPGAKNKVIVGALNLSQVAAILEHK